MSARRRTYLRYAQRYGRVVIELADHYHFAEYDREETDVMIAMVALALGVDKATLVENVRKQMWDAHGS